MYLSKWEERALQGEFGEAVRIAMEIVVNVGEFLGAEKLVPISHAHVAGVSIFNIGRYGLELLEDLVAGGARVRVYTTANPASLALEPSFRDHYPLNLVEAQRRVIELLTAMGVDPSSFTCTPYELRKPSLGERLAWAESSAVIVANSVFGARTNREGGPLALAAAIVGRTYEAGMHLDENRVPTEIIDATEVKLDSVLKASLLGLRIGSVTHGVPLIKLGKKLSFQGFGKLLVKNLLASIATTSSSALAIVEGLYPERIVVEKGLERIAIDERELSNELEECRDATVLLLGCPHLDCEELEHLVREFARSGLRRYVQRIVATVSPRVGDECVEEVRKVVEELGVELVVARRCCAVVSDLSPLVSTVATPHGKALHYLPKLAGVRSCPVRL